MSPGNICKLILFPTERLPRVTVSPRTERMGSTVTSDPRILSGHPRGRSVRRQCESDPATHAQRQAQRSLFGPCLLLPARRVLGDDDGDSPTAHRVIELWHLSKTPEQYLR